MSKTENLINAIDALLPQTQCQLCQYPGCRPYAEAIVMKGEKINRCLPGGVNTLRKLGALLQQDPEPYVEALAKQAKPLQFAVIREAECIGCTKCIGACPVDAIIGASKQMHTVITDACNGCGLCVDPCPVDCIDLIPTATPSETQQQQLAEQSRQRYQQHQHRLERQKHQQQTTELQQQTQRQSLSARQAAIQASVARKKRG